MKHILTVFFFKWCCINKRNRTKNAIYSNVRIQANIIFVFSDLLWTEESGIIYNKNHMARTKVRSEHAFLGPFHALMQRNTLKACININLYFNKMSLLL